MGIYWHTAVHDRICNRDASAILHPALNFLQCAPQLLERSVQQPACQQYQLHRGRDATRPQTSTALLPPQVQETEHGGWEKPGSATRPKSTDSMHLLQARRPAGRQAAAAAGNQETLPSGIGDISAAGQRAFHIRSRLSRALMRSLRRRHAAESLHWHRLAATSAIDRSAGRRRLVSLVRRTHCHPTQTTHRGRVGTRTRRPATWPTVGRSVRRGRGERPRGARIFWKLQSNDRRRTVIHRPIFRCKTLPSVVLPPNVEQGCKTINFARCTVH
jgi:hypothetical protein